MASAAQDSSRSQTFDLETAAQEGYPFRTVPGRRRAGDGGERRDILQACIPYNKLNAFLEGEEMRCGCTLVSVQDKARSSVNSFADEENMFNNLKRNRPG